MDLPLRNLEKFPYGPEDIRYRLLASVLEASADALESDTNDELVRKAVDTVRSLLLPDKDGELDEFKLEFKLKLDKFKEEIFKQVEPMFSDYADVLARTIGESGTRNITIISVGSGTKGDTEQKLDSLIKDKLKGNVDIRWIGIDTHSPAELEESFFSTTDFFDISGLTDVDFRAIAGIDASETFFIMANYSYHHMDVPFIDFLSRCEGAHTVFLLEEPTDKARWDDDGRYRYARIVYDLLGNVAINPKWAKIFLRDPSAFKVRYLTYEKANRYGAVVKFPDIFPETALVTVDLKEHQT